ncbi:uncharacterized protein LOC132903194 [Amyelois transitella]|uniref:uncharacterized protein LOC132903194 n=1 Tax=Amyelois transitella TaxID=680683 RepID=UPI00298FDBD0|nr:uncharacterized protein LOC132903194 [Amyelois transitella]
MLALNCYTISDEYFIEGDEVVAKDLIRDDVETNLTATNNTKRRSAVPVLKKEKHRTISEEYYEYDDVKFYVLSKKFVTEPLFLKHTKLDKNVMTSSRPTASNALTTTNHSTTTTPSTPYNIFKDYEYVNEDINSDTRQEVEVQENTTTPLITVPLAYPKVNKTATESSLQYIDFFNLSPAAQDMSLKNVAIDRSKITANTWYVPERYPCWDLSVVYGEFSRKPFTDVFAIHKTTLKNVIDLGKHRKKQRFKHIDVTVEVVNKWCSVSPCFGDHTLCLFKDNSVAKICGKNYVIYTPTMAQQMALVNTINSMRNRIASGESEEYKNLPPAANMKQMIYDYDLEKMSSVWLHQCLPGQAPCSALDGSFVSPLECTKYADQCCNNSGQSSDCVPRHECFLPAIIGCIYTWFLTALKKISKTDVTCGHIQATTFPTVQLLWANTYKIGCAYGKKSNGDVRVVCNFAPGAPFSLGCLYHCGFIDHKDVTAKMSSNTTADFTNAEFLSQLGITLNKILFTNRSKYPLVQNITYKAKALNENQLDAIFKQNQFREKKKVVANRTKGMLARLVTKYVFSADGGTKCDSDDPIYIAGAPGSRCIEKGRRFNSLCYDFRDPTPGYRLVAVVAPMALFSVILYDLFSGVVRQSKY